MPVVSNTSPLLNLSIIGRLSFLRDQFGEIWIPLKVVKELRVEEDLPGCWAIREAIKEGWIKTKEVKDLALVRVLEHDLDGGEAEAIALAIQLKADWILLDELEGRRMAKLLGLKVVGVLGILLKAQREGKLQSLQMVLKDLQEKAGFRIRKDLLIRVLQESGEKLK